MKKRMKQLLAMTLAASMVASLSVSALAEEGGGLKRRQRLRQSVRMTVILWWRL